MTHSRTFVRDDGETEVDVNFTVDWGQAPSGLSGLPEDYDPGSGDEVCIEGAFDRMTGAKVELTEAEAERFETEVSENAADYEPGEPDYDCPEYY